MAQPKTIRELLVKLGVTANTKPVITFDKVIKKAKDGATRFVKFLGVLSGAATGAGAAVLGLATHTALVAEEIGQAAQRVGLTTDQLQELRYAATSAGVEVNDLQGAFISQANNAASAAAGNEELIVLFRKLGVQIRDTSGKIRPQADLFVDIAEGLSKITDETLRTSMAAKIYGDVGAKLMPLFLTGARGIDEYRKRAHELGIVLGRDAIQTSMEYTTILGETKTAILGVKNEIGIALLPMVRDAIQAMRDWIVTNREIVSEKIDLWAERLGRAIKGAGAVFREVDRVVQKTLGGWGLILVTATTAAGGLFALLGSGLVLGAIAGVVSGLAAIGSLVGGGVLAGVTLLTGAIAGLIAWLAPLVIAFGAVYLVLDDLITYFHGGDSAIGALLDTMEQRGGIIGTLAKWLRTAVDAMKSAYEWLGKLWERFKADPTGMLRRAWDAMTDVPKAAIDGIRSVRAPGGFAVGAVASLGARSAAKASASRTVIDQSRTEIPITINNPDPEAAGAAVARHIAEMNRGAAAAFDGGEL